MTTLSLSLITYCSYFIFTPDEWHLFFPYILFHNAISLNNGCATIAGLFNYGQAKQWIVTPKFGIIANVPCCNSFDQQERVRKEHVYDSSLPTLVLRTCGRWLYQHGQSACRRIKRVYGRYFLVSVYLFYVAYVAHQKSKYGSALHLAATSIMYFIMAFGYMGRPQK